VLVALLVIALATIVVYRTSTGWRPHLQADAPPPLLKIDPNVATWDELASLPEIGPTLAKRIVEYRRQRQDAGAARPFASEEDLDKVPGIGPRTLEEIRPYLSFN